MADPQEADIMPAWTQSRRDEAIGLYKKGFSYEQIASQLGSSRGAVAIQLTTAFGRKRHKPKSDNGNQGGLNTIESKPAAAKPIPNKRESDIVPPGDRVRFVDLETNACRWPIGGHPGVDPDFGFCGKPQFRGVPGDERFGARSCYCLGHFKRSLPLERRNRLDEALRAAEGKRKRSP